MKSPCTNCKYFNVCGDQERTEPCSGREEIVREGNYKVRCYDVKGKFQTEIEFATLEECEALWMCFPYDTRPTVWKKETKGWSRVSGY